MLTNHFSYCQISSSFPSFLLLHRNQFESLIQWFAFNWKALPNASLNNVVTDVLWYWLFVNPVFKREHLTGICSVVYFHPFAFSPRFGWASGDVLGLCQEAAETSGHFKVMSWEPTETNQLPRLAGRFFYLFITPLMIVGMEGGRSYSCLSHSPLKIKEVRKWVGFDFQ